MNYKKKFESIRKSFKHVLTCDECGFAGGVGDKENDDLCSAEYCISQLQKAHEKVHKYEK